jgi:hypothetical protein
MVVASVVGRSPAGAWKLANCDCDCDSRSVDGALYWIALRR